MYAKWKGYDSRFNSWNDKKRLNRIYIIMSQDFPEPFRSFGININVKVDLSNYATKTDLENVAHVDTKTICFALKANLASLKNEVDKLVIDKISTSSC